MIIGDKIVALHGSLSAADIRHAFGGALALAWCTEQARGTADIDLNIFLPAEDHAIALDALPDGVTWDDGDTLRLARDAQARLWWDETPVDLFFTNTPYHEEVATRIRWEPFGGASLPFLDCGDLAVFKAFFDRERDWGDLSEMLHAGTLDVDAVARTLASFLGPDDHRIRRLRELR